MGNCVTLTTRLRPVTEQQQTLITPPAISPRPLSVKGDLYREDHVHILSDRVAFATLTVQQGSSEGDFLQVTTENGTVVLRQQLSSCFQLSRIDESGLILQELRGVVAFLPQTIIDIMCTFFPLQEEALDDPISVPSVAFHLPDEEPPLRPLPASTLRGGVAWLSSRTSNIGVVSVNAWRFYFQDNRPSTAAFTKTLFSALPNNEPPETAVVCDSNENVLVCAQGSRLSVWTGNGELKTAPSYLLKAESGEEVVPSCAVIANCGADNLARVLLITNKSPDTIFVFDFKQTEIVEEWKLNTTILSLARCKETEGKLVAAGINSVFVIDTFATDNKVSWLADYSQRREMMVAPDGGHERILIAAQSPQKLLAASNDERKLRIYNGVSRRTRARISLGPLSRIRALQIAEKPNSQYVIITKTHCVMLFTTVVEPWSGRSMFDGVAGKLLHGVIPCKLTVSHADCIRFNIDRVAFTPAAVYESEDADLEDTESKQPSGAEFVIASSTGAFVVIWTVFPRFSSDLSASYVSYSISKQSEPIAHLLWGPNRTLVAVSAVSRELFAVTQGDDS